MIRKNFSIIFFLLFQLFNLFSQVDQALLTIDGRQISADEFMRIYRKNNNLAASANQGIDEYLDLFINFKLKVIEAENLGLDTSAAFHAELDGYVRQLAKPYLTDSLSFENLLREAYGRMKTEIHASHIMLMLDEKASPEDTLMVYRKILEIRNRILDGEDFSVLAKTYSEDPSAATNGGDLGWFGAFKMVYPFESAAYNTPPGEISLPVRSGFGYHIIKVHEKRPAKPLLHVAHIFVRAPESMTPEEASLARLKIFSIYNRLKTGESFEAIAKTESDDKSTGINGGVLPWFSSGEMIPVFENAAYDISDTGMISEPIQSFSGWHIIKLLDKKTVRSFEEEKPGLIQLINSSDRQSLKQSTYIGKLKNDYHFNLFQDNLNTFYELVDSSVFKGKWDHSALLKNQDVLVTFGNKTLTISDFAKFIYQKQRAIEPYNIKIYIDNLLHSFYENELLKYETEMLVKKNPEFAQVVQEYHDGILLFDLTDRMGWSKAILDTSGLEKFYKQNRKNYVWNERVEAIILTSKDAQLTEKARILAEKNGSRKWFDADYLKRNTCPDDTSGGCFTFTLKKFEKGA